MPTAGDETTTPVFGDLTGTHGPTPARPRRTVLPRTGLRRTGLPRTGRRASAVLGVAPLLALLLALAVPLVGTATAAWAEEPGQTEPTPDPVPVPVETTPTPEPPTPAEPTPTTPPAGATLQTPAPSPKTPTSTRAPAAPPPKASPGPTLRPSPTRKPSATGVTVDTDRDGGARDGILTTPHAPLALAALIISVMGVAAVGIGALIYRRLWMGDGTRTPVRPARAPASSPSTARTRAR